MNSVQKDLRLLPHRYLKVGFGIMLVSILLVVLSATDVITADKAKMKAISMAIFLISLLVLSVTSSKTEDELTLRIRLKAFAFAFIFGVTMVIVDSIGELFIEGSVFSFMGAAELLVFMFFQYFFWLFIMRSVR